MSAPSMGEGSTAGEHADGESSASSARRPLDAAAARGDRERPPRVDEPPVVGKFWTLFRDPAGYYEELGFGYDADAVAYSVIRTPAVMLTHPAYVQQVLVEDAPQYRKGEVLSRAFERLAPNGLVATEGEQWARDRALAQPAFYQDRIETYADAMVEETEATADAWADADVVRVNADAKDLTLRIIARTMFGTDLSGRGAVIRDAADAIIERTSPTNPSSFLPPWVPTPANRRFLGAMSDLRGAMTEMVAERRSAATSGDGPSDGGGDGPGNGGGDGPGNGGDDLLSMLVDAEYDDGTKMDHEVLQDHLITFVFAGHETTALLVTWALWSLATHEDAQSKLHAELDDVLPADGDGRPTPDAIRDAAYLQAVVDETTRRYPPAYNTFREAKEDVEIGPWTIDAGTTLTLPQWVVHRDPRWYDDPDAFDPDRWTPAMRDALPEYAHYPFGGGPRSCIGNRFATLEAKLILATLLSRFDVDALTEDVGVSFTATLQPDRPIRLSFRERDG